MISGKELVLAVALCITCGAYGSSPTPSPFVSLAQEVVELVGDTALFECIVQDSSKRVLWRRNGSTVASGTELYLDGSKLEVQKTGNEYRLIVNDVTFDDEGAYECEIIGGNSLQQNTLIVHEAAAVQLMSYRDQAEVGLGESLLLECHATGRPQPLVRWKRIDNVLPSGETEHEGQELIIHNAGRTDSGIYECIADNVAGPPASQTLDVIVKFAPTLHIEKSLIHTGPGMTAQIVCLFSASPTVTTTWLHNGSVIDYTLRNNLRESSQEAGQYGDNKSILSIQTVRPGDLGVYTCRGYNDLGDIQGNVTLSAVPYDLVITSEPESDYSNQYRLIWRVKSTSQLVQFSMYFTPLEGQDTDVLGEANIHEANIHANIPVPLGHDKPSHHYTFSDLTPNSTYIVRLQAINLFGRSDWTENFSFHTADEGKTAPVLLETTPTTKLSTSVNSGPGNGATISPASNLLHLAAAVLFSFYSTLYL